METEVDRVHHVVLGMGICLQELTGEAIAAPGA